MIDVIIPAYNSYDTIDKTLTSISLQSCSDILNVYIINDASEYNYKEYVDFYSKFINIKELSYKENKGPGFARQYGIDNSNSKYIVFIDSDDTFYDSLSIKKLYDAVEKEDLDFVNSIFCEESKSNLEQIENDVVWLHGKIYKRDFLIKNNIRFNDTRSNEDNGFNTLLLLNHPKEKYLNEITYIWHNNKNSTTRKNDCEYKYKGIYGYIENIVWALNQKKSNKEISKIAYAALYTVYLTYIEYAHKKDIDELLRKSNKLYELYNMYPINEHEKEEIIKYQFENLYSNVDSKVLLKKYISFIDFIKMVGDSNND